MSFGFIPKLGWPSFGLKRKVFNHLKWIWLGKGSGPPIVPHHSRLTELFRDTFGRLRDGWEILVHCDSGFHRGPQVMAAFVRVAGWKRWNDAVSWLILDHLEGHIVLVPSVFWKSGSRLVWLEKYCLILKQMTLTVSHALRWRTWARIGDGRPSGNTRSDLALLQSYYFLKPPSHYDLVLVWEAFELYLSEACSFCCWGLLIWSRTRSTISTGSVNEKRCLLFAARFRCWDFFIHSVFVHSFFKPAGFLHRRHDVALDLSKRCGNELFRALYLVDFLNG